MRKNILCYIGFILSVTGLTILWTKYGLTAWFVGLVVAAGMGLENCGYDEE